MATFNGTNGPDVWIGTSGDDTVTNIGLGLDIITTGEGDDTITVIPDGGGLLDLLPDVISMGPGFDRLILDNRGSSQPIVMSQPLLDLAAGGLGLSVNLGGLERLTVSGVDQLTVYGGLGNDTIVGGDQADTLNGGGGADTLRGGGGDDTYYVDNRGDLVEEAVNAGSDRVFSSIDYALTDNVETLQLTGSAGLSGTGNALQNTIIGNAGANVLDGRAGADVMTGGAGDDAYRVDNVADRVVELVNGGTDKVYTSVDFDLTDTQVENIIASSDDGLRLRGNALDNGMTGGDGNDVLFGGHGADRMKAGLGDDRYYVDSTRDTVTEAANAGRDSVYSDVTYRLGANVEDLHLRGSHDNAAVGNALDNALTGNSGDNQISGGLGLDTLRGLGGSDRFDFNSILESTVDRSDRILDLTDSDVIDLSGIDAKSTSAGGQAFTLVDTFSNQAGQLTLTYDAGHDETILRADVNGDGLADFQVFINGDHSDFDNFVF